VESQRRIRNSRRDGFPPTAHQAADKPTTVETVRLRARIAAEAILSSRTLQPAWAPASPLRTPGDIDAAEQFDASWRSTVAAPLSVGTED
jgi:hypothetical protein